MIEHVIHIGNDGNAIALWTEAIELQAIGSMVINRASEIEYSNERKLWQVKIDGQIKFEHTSRGACIDWEHEFFNAELLAK